MSARVLIVVTHLTGSGHLVRALALARALRQRGSAVTVLSGGRPLPHLDTGEVALVQLPPVTVGDLDYSRLLDADGRPAMPALMAARLAGALECLELLRPTAVVTETWPFGRGTLRAEYAALIAAALAMPVPPVLHVSIRDIPEPPKSQAKARRAEAALAPFRRILVHGDPTVSRFTDHWPLPEALAGRIAVTGYVTTPMPQALPSPEVLVSVGGGAIGRGLLRVAAEAAGLGDRPWRLLVGGPDAAAAARALPGPALAEPVRADYRARLAGAAASVSLCGYNTACDLMQCTTPAVLVPMAEGGEQEQGLRARALERLGLAVIDPAELTPGTLLAMVEHAIAAGPRSPPRLHLDGADRAAVLIRAAG